MNTILIYTASDYNEVFFTDRRGAAVAKMEELRGDPGGGDPLYTEDLYDLDALTGQQAAELAAILSAETAELSDETRKSIGNALRRHEERHAAR